ncbi:MAG: magnesium transporter MgtC [Candidatus Magasanikbacteria bacterium CG10_big_fil_rev_8_21_14_0_10_36_16]|uniref:Magnesium transporter MgtC n=1 Tax=Candidatus Magasanikbacteria bacterium CG10_big_fil_rev_8_21_14_0_10_36_16 TaxID=1974645 RepID=A0A2H0TXZ6_9BACT|nr:MAG: magnesium transporter MgtC [Candidatus Magasanikbacteria bacterium CG10_big_fil_rev_8_21_14_0_10_36_16]
MYYLYFTGQLLLAIILGGVLGWQRIAVGKKAGPRTYALVSVGSALFTILSIHGFDGDTTSRVAAQIVTGIGFLGVGVIVHQQHRGEKIVVGLTTAAGLWAVAALGMAIGAGWIWESIIASFLMLLVLLFNENKFVDKKSKSKVQSQKFIK